MRSLSKADQDKFYGFMARWLNGSQCDEDILRCITEPEVLSEAEGTNHKRSVSHITIKNSPFTIKNFGKDTY